MKVSAVAAFLVLMSGLPAAAATITIDSTNCNSGDGCYGLAWTLSVVSGSFDGLLDDSYDYKATLTVKDDPLVSGISAQTISAVDIGVGGMGVSLVELWSFPTGTGPWITNPDGYGLASKGCKDSGVGFACSSTLVNEAISGATPLEWVWYFNPDDPNKSITQVGDLHIGAKMTTLDPLVNGKLLSATASVPEPASMTLLGFGLAGLFAGARRRTQRS